jgi:hypothetical protein
MIENIRVRVISNSNTLNDIAKSVTSMKVNIGEEEKRISD